MIMKILIISTIVLGIVQTFVISGVVSFICYLMIKDLIRMADKIDRDFPMGNIDNIIK